MSDEKKQVTLKTLKTTALVDVKIGFHFYLHLKHLMFFYYEKHMDNVNVQKLVEELKTREPKDEIEAHFLTLSALIFEIENCAKEQDMLEDTQFDVPGPNDKFED